MKLQTVTSLVKKSTSTLLIIAMMLLFNSCARKTTFLTSSVVPAARGSVKVKKDDNNNYVIKMKMTGLAEAKRLELAKQVYVVWMETDDHAIKNLGRINSNSSLLSKTLKASFETVTPFKPIKIFITAEDQADTAYPDSKVVLTTSIF
jgi:hypothetical protein